MNNKIKQFRALNKDDKIILFLIFTTIGNIFVALIKFIFSLTLPSLWFFVNVYIYYKGTNTMMHEYLSYLIALIAFWSIGSAIYGMIKYKRNYNPILKAVKLTNFANALTSIMLTQIVLLDIYAESDVYNSNLVNGFSGMGISLIIIMIGLYMVVGISKVD